MVQGNVGVEATTGALFVLKIVCGYAVCIFLGALAATLLWLVWTRQMNLSALLSEANGQASVSRFQLVIFSLVIALSLFVLTMQDGQFPAISPQILILLGISASTYALGKGIAYSQPQVLTAPGEQKTAKDISATGAAVIATADEWRLGGVRIRRHRLIRRPIQPTDHPGRVRKRTAAGGNASDGSLIRKLGPVVPALVAASSLLLPSTQPNAGPVGGSTASRWRCRDVAGRQTWRGIRWPAHIAAGRG